jgi:hypothetical protein
MYSVAAGSAAWAHRKTSATKPSPSFCRKTVSRRVPSSLKISLTTSQARIFPLYRFTSVVMWSRRTRRSSSAGSAATQSGSWECQTRVWPRTVLRCAWAYRTIASAPDQSYWPRTASIVPHFISFSGVTLSNSRVSTAR